MNENIILIGMGYWGKKWYATIFGKHKFSVIEPNLNSGIDKNGIYIFRSLDEVNINTFTHAIIATPAENHLEIFKILSKTLSMSNILVEKPCGNHWLEAQEFDNCYPGYIQLHSSAFSYIYHNIKNIGNPHIYKSIRASMGPRIRKTSIIEDYLIHDLYLFMSLFQPYENIQIVSRQLTRRLSNAGNDTIFLTLYNPDVHIIGDMFSSWWYPIKERRIIIIGDKGAFIWINDDLYFTDTRYEDIKGIDEFGNIGHKLIQSEEKKINLGDKTALEYQMDNFLNGNYDKNYLYIKPVWELIQKINIHTKSII